MGDREALHTLLLGIVSPNAVYFQPPSTDKMKYPCIVYERNSAQTKFANNKPYSWMLRYTVTFISKDPDSSVIDKLMALPMCTFNRHFTSANLNHDVFDLFF